MTIRTDGDGADWLRAANPLRRPPDLIEAARAARLGAWALALFAAVEAADAAVLILLPDQARALAEGALAAAAPSPRVRDDLLQGVAPMMVLAQTLGSLLWAGVVAGLAALQWRRMTVLLPAGLVGVALWGALASLAMVSLGLAPATPGWLHLRDALALAIYLVLGAAAVRGALRLERLRGAAALSARPAG